MRLCTAFCTLWLMWLSVGNADDPKIICYYRSWAVFKVGYERLEISDIDPSLCTHLIYAYVGITRAGDVHVEDPPLDLPDNGGKAGFQKFNALRKQNGRLKTLVATGSWGGGSATYSKVAADTLLRSKYVKNVVDFVLRHGFDGFDIYWSWPTIFGGSPNDVQNYIFLLKELRESFDRNNLILSIEVSASERLAQNYYDIPQLSKYAHFILLYVECHRPDDPIIGHNAPLYPAARETSALDQTRNLNETVRYWLKQGVPAEKLILTAQFHGLSYTLKNSTEHSPGSPASGPAAYGLGLGYIGYNELCRLIPQDAWTTVWDEEQRVPYSYAGNRWISYDNVRSLIEKGKYVKAMGLGGVMVRRIDWDDHRGDCGERYPLLKALNCELREIGCSSVTTPEASTTAKIADWMISDSAPPLMGGNFTTTSEPDRTSAKVDLEYVRHPQNCANSWICQAIPDNELNAEPSVRGHGLFFYTFRLVCKNKNLLQCT